MAGTGYSGHTASAVRKQTKDAQTQLVFYPDRTIPSWWCYLHTFRMHLLSSNTSFWKQSHKPNQGYVSMVILNLVELTMKMYHHIQEGLVLLSQTPQQLAIQTRTSRHGLPVSLCGMDRFFSISLNFLWGWNCFVCIVQHECCHIRLFMLKIGYSNRVWIFNSLNVN